MPTNESICSNLLDNVCQSNISILNPICDEEECICVAVIAVGVLTAILVILLVVTTTGWVCTYCILKKKLKKINSRQCDREEDKDSTIRRFNNPVYMAEVSQKSNDHTPTPPPPPSPPPPPDTVQEHGYEIVNFTRPARVQSATNQEEILHKNEHEYDRLERVQKENEAIATSESPQQCDQRKTSSEGTQEGQELERAYSRLENKKSDSKKNAEEHIYHVLEGPSN